MADIFDYLTWRGDVPFSADPFNLVDNLVLSELAYTDFTGVLSDSFRKTSVLTADKKYFEMHSREEAEESSNHYVKAPILMDGMLSGRRFSDVKFIKYLDVINTDKDMQISAVTCLLNDGSAYVAFRGTDTTIVGWKEDFNMSYLPDTEGQLSAVRYLNEVGTWFKGPLRVGGHSKGGNFAVYAAAFCNREIQDRIINVYTNDGPGFRNEVMSREGYKNILPRVVSIVPETSIIGMLLTSNVKHIVVKSNDKGINQHFATTWQIERNRFVLTKPSPIGTFIKNSQKEWLSNIDDESREKFVNTLFLMFEETGMDTFSEMKENMLEAGERMYSTLKGLSKERQKEMRDIIDGLLKSSMQEAKDRLSDML